MQTFGNSLTDNSRAPQSAYPERRECVRQKVHIPAYANLSGKSGGTNLNLSEILDISEKGICIQTASPLARNFSLPVVLDLAETQAYILTMGTVAWSDRSGRAGISFAEMPRETRHQLKEWLFANIIAACANHVQDSPAAIEAMPEKSIEPIATLSATAAATSVTTSVTTSTDEFEPAVRPDYTSILIALAAVKREVDSAGRDLEKALTLIAHRALTFTRASGAAIVLAEESNQEEIICRARAGSDAPPVGAKLDLSSNFSGACIRTGKPLRCEDAETDLRVDRESCRLLGIRSMIAVPVRNDDTVLGLLEVFSPDPRAFIANDDMVLQRLAEMIAGAIKTATYISPAKLPPVSLPEKSQPLVNFPSGSSGFREAVPLNPGLVGSEAISTDLSSIPDAGEVAAKSSTSWFGRVLLTASAATLLVALGWVATPWVKNRIQAFTRPQSESNRIAAKAPLQPAPSATDSEGMLRLAEQGDPVAQFEVGARYATGEDVPQDYSQALIWFSKAAEQGNVAAQATMGAYYWAGRGVPQDLSKAYYWAVLAEAGGDEGSKYRVALLASRLSRAQILAEQKRAEDWITSHKQSAKSSTGPAQ